jgi:hypothetical protein
MTDIVAPKTADEARTTLGRFEREAQATALLVATAWCMAGVPFFTG